MAECCDLSPRVEFTATGITYDVSGALDAIAMSERAVVVA
jgi:hypothetical protein